jgi:exopolyphosphatase/guanosine-5'-triphosphate,3'-diphosphate pyrophosphatase
MILFRQLKVLHKLSRSYVRILRVASYLHDSGLRVSYTNKEKNSFNSIISSEVYGVTHNELVLAGFVSSLRNADNFNLSDWVRYKDLVTEEQLEAVRKLAVILKLAECLDITGFARITDISCDILGDSVIMKTITEENVDLEIKSAMLYGSDFKKAFNKNLEIL